MTGWRKPFDIVGLKKKVTEQHLARAEKKNSICPKYIALKFIDTCKSYGYDRYVPPSRGDLYKVIGLSKLGVDVIDLIDKAVANWSEIPHVKSRAKFLPDLGLFPLIYKDVLQMGNREPSGPLITYIDE